MMHRDTRHRPSTGLIVTILIICSLTGLATIIRVRHHASGNAKVARPQCAQYCIGYCCLLLGIPVQMDTIMDLLPPKKEGENMLEIGRTLEKIGLSVQGRNMKLEELFSASFPLIAHTKQQHFMVVASVDSTSVGVFDSAKGWEKLTVRRFAEVWDGKALTLEKPAGKRILPAFLPRPHEAGPTIRFDTLYKHVGDVPQRQSVVDFKFPFRNTGRENLVIHNVRTNCGCMDVQKPEEPVRPGQKAEILLRYKMKQTGGRFSHKAYVRTNDPIFPVLELAVGGKVVKQVYVQPSRLDFGDVTIGEVGRENVFVSYKGDEILLLSQPEIGLERVTIGRIQLDNEKLLEFIPKDAVLDKSIKNRYVLVAEIDAAGAEPDEIETTVKIKTNLSDFPEIILPVTASFSYPVVARPAQLYLGEIWRGKPIEQNISLWCRSARTFRIDAVDVNAPGLTCNYDRAPAELITLRFQGTAPQVRHFLQKRTINVKVLMPHSGQAFTLRIPIYAYLKNPPPADTTG